MMITSTAGSASSACSASTISVTAYGPWTATCRTRNRTAGQRRAAFLSTSRSAAESRPQIRPTTPGRNGSGRLRSAANRPSAASERRSLSSRASSSPMPTVRISKAVSENEPLAVLKSGLAQRTTRAPWAGGGSWASRTPWVHITRPATAAPGSRRVRNPVLPRRFSSAIWPPPQTRPRRPPHSPTSRSTVRTGTGDSGEVSSGIRVSPARPPGPARLPFALRCTAFPRRSSLAASASPHPRRRRAPPARSWRDLTAEAPPFRRDALDHDPGLLARRLADHRAQPVGDRAHDPRRHLVVFDPALEQLALYEWHVRLLPVRGYRWVTTSYVPPRVDRDVVAGDVTGRGRDEEADGVRHVGLLDEAAQGGARRELGEDLSLGLAEPARLLRHHPVHAPPLVAV